MLSISIVGCGPSELDRCVDANINTQDNKLDEIVSIWEESRILKREYDDTGVLVDDSDSGMPGFDMLWNLYNNMYDEGAFDTANLKALECWFELEGLSIPDVFYDSVDDGKRKLSSCYEKHVVDAKTAQKICHRQGIY